MEQLDAGSALVRRRNTRCACRHLAVAGAVVGGRTQWASGPVFFPPEAARPASGGGQKRLPQCVAADPRPFIAIRKELRPPYGAGEEPPAGPCRRGPHRLGQGRTVLARRSRKPRCRSGPAGKAVAGRDLPSSCPPGRGTSRMRGRGGLRLSNRLLSGTEPRC